MNVKSGIYKRNNQAELTNNTITHVYNMWYAHEVLTLINVCNKIAALIIFNVAFFKLYAWFWFCIELYYKPTLSVLFKQ